MEYNCNLDTLMIDENSGGRKYARQKKGITNKLRAQNDLYVMGTDL